MGTIVNKENLKKLRPYTWFNDGDREIKSLTFSTDGAKVLASTENDSLLVYDVKSCKKTRSIMSKKYGVSHAKFASKNTCAVHGSTKVDNVIRYLNLRENRYLRYFSGHTDLVTGISMSPDEETFLSVSKDKTVRLWDLKSGECTGVMDVEYDVMASYDPMGIIFGAGMNSEFVKLYDLRTCHKGPFANFEIRATNNCEWSDIKFSPDGKFILISTNTDSFLLIDAFNGTTKCVFRGHQNELGIPLEACFTPDSKFVFCGSSDKKVYLWDIDGVLICSYGPYHRSTPHIVQTRSNKMILASAGRQILFWAPRIDIRESSIKVAVEPPSEVDGGLQNIVQNKQADETRSEREDEAANISASQIGNESLDEVEDKGGDEVKHQSPIEVENEFGDEVANESAEQVANTSTNEMKEEIADEVEYVPEYVIKDEIKDEVGNGAAQDVKDEIGEYVYDQIVNELKNF